jgi:patatin-related protein
MPHPNDPDIRSVEFRLGIVLYGGVSLAVYENGVAQEFFRAVKGEGVYTLLKKILDADIVIDIMSGTSAGGINGVMLGYALSNDLDFPSSAALWREDGDILKLLDEKYDPGKTNSILNSTGYYQPCLEAAYKQMGKYTAPPREVNSCSPCSELDVFVTGTNVEGRIYTVFDADGHPIDIKDHREVFVLSYREGRKNEFDPENYTDLSTLSRLTSCFPVAFEPVPVTQADKLLVRWGHLPGCDSFEAKPPEPYKFYFLDGAVLNNKPFSSTINAIFHRTTTGMVDRYLLYVDPAPEKFKWDRNPAEPDVVAAATDALIGIPGYQSIAGDLKTIEHHNDQVKRYWEIFAAVRGHLMWKAYDIPPAVGDIASLALPEAEQQTYFTARMGQLRDRVVDGVTRNAGFRQPLDEPDKDKGRVLVNSFRLLWGASAAPSAGAGTLTEFDIYFRSRRLFFLTYRISSLLKFGRDTDANGKKLPEVVPLKPEERRQYSELRQRINHHINLLEMIQFAMENTVDYAPIAWQKSVSDHAAESTKTAKPTTAVAEKNWKEVRALLRSLLDTNDAPPMDAATAAKMSETDAAAQRKTVMKFLSARITRIVKPGFSPQKPEEPEKPQRNLLSETDRLEWLAIREFAPGHADDLIAREYSNFLLLDAQLFPMERLSGIGSLDQIKIVRLSPDDAKQGFSDRDAAQKICGKELAHFSGFLKSSWRANDVMWGRLDAVCQLVETLVTPDTLKRAGAQSHWPNADDLKKRFPNSTDDERGALLKAINGAVPGNRARPAVDELQKQLILAAQREILAQEIPCVIQEAVRQQRAWNNYKISSPPTPMLDRCGAWTVGVRQLDKTITDYAAEQLGKEGVGESWKTDIPKPVLLEIFSKATIGLREALLTSAGKHADSIRSNMLFKLAFVWPVNFIYRLANLQRTAPEFGAPVLWALVVASLTVLVVDCHFYKQFLGTSRLGGVDYHGLLYWVAIPLAVLIIPLWLLYWRSEKT